MIDFVIKKLNSLNLEDFVVLFFKNRDRMIRFTNNSITVTKDKTGSALFIYMAKERKRIAGATYDLRKGEIASFISSLYKSMMASSETEYAHLPRGPFRYVHNGDIDTKIGEEDLTPYVSRAIYSALENGAKRVAGSLSAFITNIEIFTSGGAEGRDIRTGIELNVRAFTSKESSGHGIAVSTRLSSFNPEEAGRLAGMYSKMAKNPKTVREGRYRVLLSSTVAANIFEHVGISTSAFMVEAGLSFFKDKIGEKVAVSNLTLIDHGQIQGGLDSRSFDDEGLPTKSNKLIDSGILLTYIHNSTTAKKFKTESTANAGIIEPHPWNLEVKSGDMDDDEMIRELKSGIIVTNNWYTRFQSYRTGEFSTIPRDAAFLVENGEVKASIHGFRLSDSIPRLLNSISGIGKKRRWIKWWEVETPTLSPQIIVDGMTVTKAL